MKTTVCNWETFLSIPVAMLEEHGLPLRVVVLLEKRFSVLYIRDLQPITVDQFMSCRQIGAESLQLLQVSLKSLLAAIEKGEYQEWTYDDLKQSRGE